MKGPAVLDSFALVSLFHREPGWQKVREVLQSLKSKGDKAHLCMISWAEFYYVLKRRVGRVKAEEALRYVFPPQCGVRRSRRASRQFVSYHPW